MGPNRTPDPQKYLGAPLKIWPIAYFSILLFPRTSQRKKCKMQDKKKIAHTTHSSMRATAYLKNSLLYYSFHSK